jgi:hypothetical protein
MNDDRFERELRGFLAAREPRSVSPMLRARLLAVSAEPPPGVGALGGRLRDAWRVAVGVAVTAGLAIVLLALLARTGGLTLTDRIPGPVGAPSAAPVVPALPFVTAPTDFFSAAALADADRRLAALYATSAIEGRLIVRMMASVDELSTPPGWPDGYKADRNGDADVTAILGVGPDGTVTCCVTITGSLIDRAKEDGYWRPASWPDRLERELESDDRAIRDTALDRFVRGIEALEPGIAMTRVAIERESTMRQFILLLVGSGMLVALLLVTRYRWSVSRARPAADEGALDVATIRAATGAGTLDPDLPSIADVHDPDAAPVAWTSGDPNSVPNERRLVAAALAALTGLLALGASDLVRPAAAGLPLDVDAATIGLASPTLPVVPVTLLATAIVALLLVARSGGWRRRLTVGALIVLVGLAGWWAFDGSRPVPSANWIPGRGAGQVERGGGGLFDAQTYPLQPDAPFTFGMTVRNHGALPVTILGLDGVQSTVPNPYVATIVGLGSVEQSTVDGFVTTLSARPEDTTVAWPSTVAPGEEIAIVLLGRAGPCAEPTGTGSGLPFLHVQVTYRVLGIERSETVGLPVALFVPSKATCTVEVPGGTVTYGEP